MENIKKHPISTVLGLLIMIFSGVLLFVQTNYEISKTEIAIVFAIGALLCFAKDNFISIITLGLDRFFKPKQ